MIRTSLLLLLELSFNSKRLFVRSWLSMFFHRLFCIKNQLFLSTSGACLEVVFKLNEEQPIFSLLRAELN